MCACAVDGVSFTLTPFATVNFWRGRGVGQVRKREEERVGARRQKSRQTWLANEDPQQCVCAAVHAWCDARSGVCQVHAARGEADGDRLRTTTVH